jgi:outer membrane protein TolC
MKKTFLFLVLLSSFLNGEVLTLKECIDKTLKNHPDIKTFLLKEEQSKYGYKSARADYLPQINLNANYNAVQTYVFPSALTGTFNTKDDSGWNAGVYAKQKIWDFSKTTSKIKATKKDKDISKLSLKDLEALMAYKVRGLYALMVVQKEAIDVRKKDLEAKEAYYKQAKALEMFFPI